MPAPPWSTAGPRPGVCEHPGGQRASGWKSIPRSPSTSCARADCGAIWPAASWPSTGMTATTSPGVSVLRQRDAGSAGGSERLPLRGGAITPGHPAGKRSREERSFLPGLAFLGGDGEAPAGAFGGGSTESVFGRWSGLDRRRLAPARWVPARSRAGDPGFLEKARTQESRGDTPPPPGLGPARSHSLVLAVVPHRSGR